MEDLSYIDKERLAHIETLLGRLSSIKIVDAPILLKIYDLYRYKAE